MDSNLQTVCAIIGVTAGVVSIAANSIKIGEWARALWIDFLKKIQQFAFVSARNVLWV
jgi:hypothetical protein